MLDLGIISVKVAQVMKNMDRGNYCPTDPYLDRPQHIGFGVNISAPHMVIYRIIQSDFQIEYFSACTSSGGWWKIT